MAPFLPRVLISTVPVVVVLAVYAWFRQRKRQNNRPKQFESYAVPVVTESDEAKTERLSDSEVVSTPVKEAVEACNSVVIVTESESVEIPSVVPDEPEEELVKVGEAPEQLSVNTKQNLVEEAPGETDISVLNEQAPVETDISVVNEEASVEVANEEISLNPREKSLGELAIVIEDSVACELPAVSTDDCVEIIVGTEEASASDRSPVCTEGESVAVIPVGCAEEASPSAEGMPLEVEAEVPTATTSAISNTDMSVEVVEDMGQKKKISETAGPATGELECNSGQKSVPPAENEEQVEAEYDSATDTAAHSTTANSPSDIMMASPSGGSAYSDEGSLDSGKGGSDDQNGALEILRDVESPQSNDLLAVQYPVSHEFLISQSLAGKLIGRGGVFVNQIRNKTGATVFVRDYSLDSEMQIVSVEGFQSSIKDALHQIRERFPLSKYPQLTLEAVDMGIKFRRASPILFPNIPSGQYQSVIVTKVVSPSSFFVLVGGNAQLATLATVSKRMDAVYNLEGGSATPPIKPQQETVNSICAFREDGHWHRGIVIEYLKDEQSCVLRGLDHGGHFTVPCSDMRQLRIDLLRYKFSIMECSLHGVQPICSNEWLAEEIHQFRELAEGKDLELGVVENVIYYDKATVRLRRNDMKSDINAEMRNVQSHLRRQLRNNTFYH